jgi:uncharacterized protein YwqG
MTGRQREVSLDNSSIQVRERLAAAGLARVADPIAALVRPAIRLKTTRVPEGSIPLGASKVGGSPDLPREIDWPWWEGLPLSFVAQVNLGEAATHDSERALPPTGLLLFFWTDMRWDAERHSVEWIYGTHPVQGRAIYMPADTALERRPLPANPAFAEGWEACAVTYLPHPTLPSPQSAAVAAFHLDRQEQDRYYDLAKDLHELNGNSAYGHPSHWLLGYPEPLQGDDMAMECQYAAHGLSHEQMYSDPHGSPFVPSQELLEGIADWRLLLQMGEDDNAGMQWNDSGCIYYWIRRQDLQSHRFDQTRIVEQSL